MLGQERGRAVVTTSSGEQRKLSTNAGSLIISAKRVERRGLYDDFMDCPRTFLHSGKYEDNFTAGDGKVCCI